MPRSNENLQSEEAPIQDFLLEAEAGFRAGPQHVAAVEHTSQKKKRILALVLLIVCALALGGFLGSQAYIVKQTQADNVISFGNVKIRLLETMLTDEGEQAVPKDFSEKLQGDAASRIVRVQNAAEQPCWVRVQLNMKATEGDSWIDANSAVTYGFGENVLTEFPSDGVLPDNSWVYVTDSTSSNGWFYYTTPLDAFSGTVGASGADLTNVLIESLDIDSDKLGGKQRQYQFDIQVQAVQTKNNDISALDAEGWPTSTSAKVGA